MDNQTTAIEPVELSEELFQLVSGGAGPEMDPNGGQDIGVRIDPNG